MMTLMSDHQSALIWLVGGLLLLLAEMLAPGVFMMWLGLAALGTGLIVLLLDPGLALQVIAFAIFTTASIYTGLRLRRPPGPRVVNTAESGLLNRPARVLPGDDLRVRVGDSDWPARLAHGTPQPTPGTTLRVVAVDGTTVVVGTPAG